MSLMERGCKSGDGGVGIGDQGSGIRDQGRIAKISTSSTRHLGKLCALLVSRRDFLETIDTCSDSCVARGDGDSIVQGPRSVELAMTFVVDIYNVSAHFPREERYGLTA